ncbi:MAG: proteasome assembly chaperone family protein, partial [Acidilobaceae archaeon]
LEIGLGVMGPLASLYMYLDYEEVPSIMILPYSMVEGVDYDASLLAVKIVSRKLLEVDVRLAELETLARTQKAEVERMISMIEREERESKGIFM